MRFYDYAHRFYCGVDLHARTMYLCILDHAGQIVLHHEVPADPAAFLEAIPARSSRPRLARAGRKLHASPCGPVEQEFDLHVRPGAAPHCRMAFGV